jgi:hypothetical protein
MTAHAAPPSNIIPFAPGEALPRLNRCDYEPLFREVPAPPTVRDVQAETMRAITTASLERGIHLGPRETALAIELAIHAYRRGCEHAGAELSQQWHREFGPATR